MLQIRECRQEKFEQLNVLKRICDNMGSLNVTDLNLNTSFTQLEDTIKTLNQTAHAEDIELEKEEEEVAKLNATVVNYVCHCTYNSWGEWGSCYKTCKPDGIKGRSRTVKWYPRNNGTACTEADKQDSSACNRDVCCRKYIWFLGSNRDCCCDFLFSKFSC